MDVYVARQPIFNTNKEIYAYELLFRSGMTNAFPNIDGDTATTSLLSTSFFTTGIDKISGGKKSFINFTQELLVKRYPEMFPAEKIMIEVLENITPTKEIYEACSELKEKGYELALDDFVYEESYTELIKISDIIKIDFLMTPRDQVEKMVKTLGRYDCKLLAEKIETYEDFQDAQKMGFVYFQGYFFSKPEILQNKDISSNQFAILQLMNEVNKNEIEIERIEELMNQDVSTSYKLLNYLNSAYFNRLQPISSIRQAIAFLGGKGLRQFISLIAIGQLASGKPNELIRTSIIRARFLELIGPAVKKDGGELFMLGLFSLIDAMLDNSMESLVKKMPISEPIAEALAWKKGEYYPFLQIVENYESGDWETFEELLSEFGIDSEIIVENYVEAVGWADSF